MLAQLFESRTIKVIVALGVGSLLSQVLAADLTQCPTFAKWDVKKNGPLLVLEPDKVKSNKGAALADFKRKIVQIGSLNAVVPDTMVVIDESGLDKPDLYDGLPMYAKVMYLLSILDKSQFDKLCKGGIGFGDLSDEQVRVFESILPKPFKWTSTTYAAEKPTVLRYTLSESDRSKVRFKINRNVSYKLFSKDNNGYSELSSTQHPLPGQPIKRRDDSDEIDPASSFGVEARKVLPNTLKAADLSYDSPFLAKAIQLMPSEKAIDLLKRVEQATGREFFADIRVANRIVVCKGSRAQISDVLKALAQSVTGTYRKVGRLYLLTSDLTGMGSRAVRFHIWNENLTQSTFIQEAQWRKTVIASGNMRLATYDANDPLAPNDLMTRSMDDDGNRKPGEGPAVDVADLPKVHQNILEQIFQSYGNDWRRDKVSLESQFSYGFVLPNGSKLMPERQNLLISDSELTPRMPDPEPSFSLPPLPKVNLAEAKSSYPLLLRVLDPNVIKASLYAASVYGFKDVWLETRSAEALKKAIEEAKRLSLNLKLVVQPLNLYGNSNGLSEDLTILGDNGDQALKRSNGLVSQIPNYDSISEEQSHRVVSLVQYAAPGWKDRFVDLAKTEGLPGIVVLSTRPAGYQKFVEHGPVIRRRAIYCLGYSLADREACIRSKSIDPCDVPPERIMLSIDLRQPFFLDDLLRGGSTVYNGRNMPLPEIASFPYQYRDALAATNKSAVETLLNDLAATGKNVLVECRPNDNGQSIGCNLLKAWTPGMKLHQIEIDRPSPWTEFDCTVFPIVNPETRNSDMMWSSIFFGRVRDEHKSPVAINALSIPPSNLEAVLSQLFVPVK